MNHQSTELEIDGDFEAANDELYRQNITDGLPIVPPTPERVEKMLEITSYDSSEIVGVIPPKYGDATVEKIAINAVMAGCKPKYMPVLVAAVEALCEEEFNLYGINATTHPVAPLVIVNGPIVREINLNYGYNVFGQGWRANSTIGRAIRLILMNVGGGQPGEMDRATHGHPGKFSFCIAENERRSPWDPLHVRRGYEEDESTVTVVAAEAPHEVNDHVSETGTGILNVTADVLATIGNNNAYVTHGEVTVVFGPEHAETVARSGYSISDIQWFIYDTARNQLSKLKSGGLYGIHNWANRFDAMLDNGKIPIVEDPENINILVAGGAGKHSMALPSFGETRSVTKPILERE